MEVGEGGWTWLVGAQNSVPSDALPKQQFLAAIGFHGTLLLEFNKLKKNC